MGTQEAREQLIQAASQLSGNKDVPLDLKQQYFNTGVAEMKAQVQMSPLDARFPLFLGILYSSYGDYSDAQVALDQAHKLSPKKQTILFEVAQNALARGDTGTGLETLKVAYETYPANIDARIYYAALLIRASQDSVADEVFS